MIDDREREWKKNVAEEKKAFLEEFLMNDKNRKWAKIRRLEYLKKQKSEILHKLARFMVMVEEHGLIEHLDIEKEMKQIKIINHEIDQYNNPTFAKGAITDAMIETAREYPIEQLIEVNKNWALCPFHAEKNPSAYCKNNYLYCFSCGEQADTIKLYQHLYNVKFKEAVSKLC